MSRRSNQGRVALGAVGAGEQLDVAGWHASNHLDRVFGADRPVVAALRAWVAIQVRTPTLHQLSLTLHSADRPLPSVSFADPLRAHGR